MKTSLFIVEDDVDFSRGLVALIGQSSLLTVSGIGATLSEARIHIDAHEDDIYLVDITLPDGNGIDIMRYVRQKYPKSKILALSTLGDEKHIVSSVAAGASGYLLKSEMPANIIHSIICLINDGGYLSGTSSKVLIDNIFQQNANATTPNDRANLSSTNYSDPESTQLRRLVLTGKEREVLANAQQGLPAKLIADGLNISIFTVNQHLRSIYRKLNVRNKMEAVQTALRHGLL